MQTPEGSPKQSRKRQSPISTITRKSWNNLRSKFGSKVQPSPSPNKSEFLLISASVPPKRSPITPHTFPELIHEVQAPLEISSANQSVSTGIDPSDTAATDPSTEGIGCDNTSKDGKMLLGEPFNGDAASERAPNSNDACSESESQFSFERSLSCRYYKSKSVGLDSTFEDVALPALQSNSLNRSADDVLLSDLRSHESKDLNEDNDLDFSDDLLDRDEYDEPDLLAEMIAEANLVTSDDELEEESVVRKPSTSSSMHRQLPQITRDDLVITFFDETRPKRTRSTISSSSSVWPIQE